MNIGHLSVEPNEQVPPAKCSRPVPPWATTTIVILAAVIVGLVASFLAHADGSAIPGAILVGGCAFAGAVALFFAIDHSLRREE